MGSSFKVDPYYMISFWDNCDSIRDKGITEDFLDAITRKFRECNKDKIENLRFHLITQNCDSVSGVRGFVLKKVSRGYNA